MDLRKNLSVLPSNGPVTTPNPAISSSIPDGFNTLHSHICQKFNLGLECRVCNLHHICSACKQPGHGANACQTGISRLDSGQPGSLSSDSLTFETELRSHNGHGSKVPPIQVNHPYHTAQAAIRVAQKKDRRTIWQRWELQSPRYLAYRRKARSKKPGTKEDVWPDHVEEAFQIGMYHFISVSRSQIRSDLEPFSYPAICKKRSDQR